MVNKVCAVCSRFDSKYKCPGCLKILCSIDCVKSHKESFRCNGKRDRTKYVDLKDFDTQTLLSDMNFYNEMSNNLYITRKKVGSNKSATKKANNFKGKASIFQKFAKKILNASVFIPFKNTANIEHFYDKKENKLFWAVKVELVKNDKRRECKIVTAEGTSTLENVIEKNFSPGKILLEHYQLKENETLNLPNLFLLDSFGFFKKHAKIQTPVPADLSLNEAFADRIFLLYPKIIISFE